jgi:type II secretory pathway pseudopilin PulG
MMPTPKPRPRTTRSAFTLVELLVVIGIIIILLGILLPVISRIRRAAQSADTTNEISQISNACNQYYTTFNAYPGPLSNDYIQSYGGTSPTLLVTHPLELYTGATTPPVQFGSNYNITGSENLVLGLMGGLRLDPNKSDTSVTPAIPMLVLAPTEVGLGPLNLNINSPGGTPTFFSAGANYLMWSEKLAGRGSSPAFQSTTYQAANTAGTALTLAPFVDQAGYQSLDSPIPEFVDRYPIPMPILYLRARVGAKGVISNGIVTDPTGATALYQYDVRDMAAYTDVNSAMSRCIGLPANCIHNLSDIGTASWPVTNVAPSASPTAPIAASGAPKVGITTNMPDAFNYFLNSSIPPTDSTNPNYSGRPRAVDQFILISAGPDGIYGTADDITSFGSVTP